MVEKVFDIEVEYPICEMREDTQLVLVDIPGINEADSSKKYKDFVESKWNTFDCVVVVMDAIQGVNTQEQVELLKLVKANNESQKHLPTIILLNKVDDQEDSQKMELVTEARAKAVEIFGDRCTSTALKELIELATEYDYHKDNTNRGAVFIPISAMNAFIYRKASHLTLETFHKFDKELVDKLGRDEVGRKWKKLTNEEKVDVIRDALSDPMEYNERLAGTNFDDFTNVLSYFIGGTAAQTDLITKQIDTELELISKFKKKNLSESIRKVFTRCRAVERSTDDLKGHFWRAYEICEDIAIARVEDEVDPVYLERPFYELEKYFKLAEEMKWKDESALVIDTMKRLLRRLFLLISSKGYNWKFADFYASTYVPRASFLR